jgi:hypothetical protein
MHSDDKSPGHKLRRNRDGTLRHYWAARHDLVAAGYRPATVRLHYDGATPEGRVLIDAACRRLQAEMLAWSASRGDGRRRFDGTIAALVRAYQRDQASPYADLKWNTRRTYDQVLGVIEKAFGKRALAALTIGDFRRWYAEAKRPTEGGVERVRKAHGIVAMLRRLFAYGVMAELPECGRLNAILAEARFKQPKRRRVRMELDQAEAIVKTALDVGRISLALGTALQFETAMRQRDVIGEWEPIAAGELATGIVLGGRRWVNGLLWSDISAELRLYKETTKTGAIVAHDLRMAPLVMSVLEYMPAERRIGPVIVDELAGRPYAEHAYAREWRTIATAAGVPRSVWNMDARAGAITEAEDAGADLDTIRGAVGHSQVATTARYSRGAIGKSRAVARLRTAHRATREREMND